MITGDPGDPEVLPLNAVRWKSPAKDWAIWVQKSSKISFEAKVFNFSGQKRPLKAEFFILNKTKFNCTLKCQNDATVCSLSPENILQAEIPSRELCVLELKQN